MTSTRGMGAPDRRDGMGAEGGEVVDISAEVVNNLPSASLSVDLRRELAGLVSIDLRRLWVTLSSL